LEQVGGSLVNRPLLIVLRILQLNVSLDVQLSDLETRLHDLEKAVQTRLYNVLRLLLLDHAQLDSG
jgi:hypothetical protein